MRKPASMHNYKDLEIPILIIIESFCESFGWVIFVSQLWVILAEINAADFHAGVLNLERLSVE